MFLAMMFALRGRGNKGVETSNRYFWECLGVSLCLCSVCGFLVLLVKVLVSVTAYEFWLAEGATPPS